MLFDSKVPLHHWVEAFFTACFLSNLLPSLFFDNQKSPYETLFGKKPDYSFLRVFVYSCYPLLRPYSSNKFEPRSLKCVFLGYNDKYKGYHCIYPPIGHLYIGRHILFEESDFLFPNSYAQYHTHATTTLLSAWQKSFLHLPPVNDAPTVTAEQLFPHPVAEQLPLPTPTVSSTHSPALSETADLNVASSPSQAQSDPLFTYEDFPPLSPPAVAVNSDTFSSESSSPVDISASLVAPTEPAVPINSHSMVTRGKDGISKPNPRYVLLTITSTPPEPSNYSSQASWLECSHD